MPLAFWWVVTKIPLHKVLIFTSFRGHFLMNITRILRYIELSSLGQFINNCYVYPAWAQAFPCLLVAYVLLNNTNFTLTHDLSRKGLLTLLKSVLTLPFSYLCLWVRICILCICTRKSLLYCLVKTGTEWRSTQHLPRGTVTQVSLAL